MRHIADIWHQLYNLPGAFANLTRQDAVEFLELAPRIPVRSHIVPMPLTEANLALDRLRAGKLTGVAVLIP